MEKVGVMAVVEGISEFMGQMGQIDKAISSIVPTSKLLGGAFDWLGDTISGFVSGAVRTLEYAIGGLITDSIEAAITAIKELIGEVVAAGEEFQILSIRLTGMNLPANADEVDNWSAAMKDASNATKDQLDWIQALSTATPFDATDIAETYSLARSYGFADNEAQRLTKNITDFTAGMGLGSDAIVRTIQNLGQMEARGKVNMQVIRNLTRSAYLPLDDVLGRVATKMGLTVAQVTKKISKPGEGVSSEIFLEAFQEMVEQESRFVGAAGRLGRAFEPAINNVKDLWRNVAGGSVVKPVLDALGASIYGLVEDLVYFNEEGDLVLTDKWYELKNVAAGLGSAISSLVSDIIDVFLPATGGMADGMIGAFESVAEWIQGHHNTIIQWAQDAKTWIDTKLIPSIKGVWTWIFGTADKDITKGKPGQQRPGAPERPTSTLGKEGALPNIFEKFVKGVKEAAKWVGEVLVPFIKNSLFPILKSLGPLLAAIGGIFTAAFGGQPNQEFTDWIRDTLIPGIQSLTDWINQNQATIALWMQAWLLGSLVIIGISTAISLIIGIIFEAIQAFIGWWIATADVYKWIGLLIAVLALAAVAWTGIPVAIVAVIAALAWLGLIIAKNWDVIKKWASDTWKTFSDWYVRTRDKIWNWVGEQLSAFASWYADTAAKIWGWVGETIASFASWYADTKSKIWSWVAETLAKIASWATETLAKIKGWAIDVFNSIKNGLTNANWSSVGSSIYNAIYNSLMSFSWFSLGVNIINQVIAGFTSISIPAVKPPTTGGGGGSTSGCFIAGTLITMDGEIQKAIENVDVGDTIISYDVKAGLPVFAHVIQTFHHIEDPAGWYILINGTIGVTADHLMYLNGRWQTAQAAEIGDTLLDMTGQDIPIESVEYLDGPVPVYNLHTDHSTHNYFANGILVHNVKQTGTHGWRTVPPGFEADNFPLTLQSGERYMVVPKGGQMSSAMAGSSVNAAQQIVNNMNLTINSSANTEPIVADFEMLKSMLGA